MATVKLLKVSASKKWFLTQLDISNAFFNGDLDEEIFMSLPEGYTERQGDSFPPKAVYQLKKSIYGLKQALRQCFLKFYESLVKLGCLKTHGDYTLFFEGSDGDFVVVLVYVDDIIIASTFATTASQQVGFCFSFIGFSFIAFCMYS